MKNQFVLFEELIPFNISFSILYDLLDLNIFSKYFQLFLVKAGVTPGTNSDDSDDDADYSMYFIRRYHSYTEYLCKII